MIEPTIFMPLHNALMAFLRGLTVDQTGKLPENVEELLIAEQQRLLASHPEWEEPVRKAREARERLLAKAGEEMRGLHSYTHTVSLFLAVYGGQMAGVWTVSTWEQGEFIIQAVCRSEASAKKRQESLPGSEVAFWEYADDIPSDKSAWARQWLGDVED